MAFSVFKINHLETLRGIVGHSFINHFRIKPDKLKNGMVLSGVRGFNLESPLDQWRSAIILSDVFNRNQG